MRRIALIALVLLAGCGGSGPEPLPDVRPVVPTPRQSAALTRVVADFARDFRGGDGRAACALLTPVTRTYVAESRGASCAEAVMATGAPPARTWTISVSPDGFGATIRFEDCRLWRLALHGDTWLIDDLPLTPRPRCERPTA
jgi:hypothetical protein